MSTLAVVIPTRNMAKYLGRALGSVCHGGADEIVVIDDASDDDTAAVVEHWKNQFPHVQYVRHAEKAADHNEAQRDVWLSLQSDQIVGMGADDYLFPGAISAIKSHADAPVVFGDADTIDTEGRYMYSHHSAFYGQRTAEQVRARFQSSCGVIESGCGSALRRDMVRWLWDMGWEQLGPMMDSVGYATIACLHGAAYVQSKTVAIMVSDASYGHRSRWTDADILKWASASIAFMRLAGLDDATVAGIARKRCHVEMRQ